MRDALGISWVPVRKGRKKVRSFCCVHVFPANRSNNGVDPRGVEPLASAMRGRRDTLLESSKACKTAANKAIPTMMLSRPFRLLARVAARLLHGAPGVTTRIFNFLLVCRKFSSGADGIRTHALRRAKAARYVAGPFRGLQNSCK